MLESLFNKVALLLSYNVFKRRLQHRCFLANITKSIRAAIIKIICERLLLPLEVFCKIFVDISSENALFGILESSVWLQLIFLFLTIIVYWLIKYLFRIGGDILSVVFITQISQHGKFTVLHNLITIVLQLTNQIK